ncbi:MAG TPA: GWxTD domain-containing protein, partial [Caldithrix sp.]|nr:GWxTD domain-containing protein [Caldithrix sp.]
AFKYNQFVDIFTIEVPYGYYKAKVEVFDNTSLKKGEYLFEINTITPENGLFLSDIELCSKISQDTVKSIYFKNGLKVVPNPRRTFDVLQPMLYFYVETNNLSYDVSQQTQYAFSYAIITTDGDTVKERKPVLKNIAGPKLVEIGGFNVMALPQNHYFLVIKAKDLLTNKEVTARTRFQVYKPTSETVPSEEDQNAIITGIYGEFTKEDLEKEFSVAQYLTSRDEEKVFKKLENAEAMKSFLINFWQSKDQQYAKKAGEFRKEYMNRVDIANERFRSMGREGWKTDRGRVFLIYGEPNEYERFPSSMDVLPYIIWHYYDLEGSQFFVFVDMDGFGDYRQIHSTYRKELQNPNWEGAISKSSGGGGF